MTLPTQEEIEQALRANATQLGNGRWSFEDDSSFSHDEASALTIVTACLTLGVPVTDVVSARTWFRMLERIVQLEERVERLERR